MSHTNTPPQTPSGNNGRVTFQSTLKSEFHTSQSFNDGPTTPKLQLSKEEVFEYNLTQLFTKGFLAVLASKDAVLKKVSDCIHQNIEERCKDKDTYMHLYWRDLHVRSGFVCIDERMAIPKSIQEAVLELIHLTEPGSCRMINLGQYIFWPFMRRKIPKKQPTVNPVQKLVRVFSK